MQSTEAGLIVYRRKHEAISKTAIVHSSIRHSLPHEHLIDFIACLFRPAVSELAEEDIKLVLLNIRLASILDSDDHKNYLVWRTVYASQNFANVATIVSVMKHADVEPRLQRGQKLVQCALPFRELECEQPFVLSTATTADEIPDVAFGKLVTTDI